MGANVTSVAPGRSTGRTYSNLRADVSFPRDLRGIATLPERVRVVRMSVARRAAWGRPVEVSNRLRCGRARPRRVATPRRALRRSDSVEERQERAVAGGEQDRTRDVPRRRWSSPRGRELRPVRPTRSSATAPETTASPASARVLGPASSTATTTTRSASPPSTRRTPAARASRPACRPPPTAKLGPVSPKAMEHSPATALGDVYGNDRGRGGSRPALADARGEERVGLEGGEGAAHDDAGAAPAARSAASSSATAARPGGRARRRARGVPPGRPRLRRPERSSGGSPSTWTRRGRRPAGRDARDPPDAVRRPAPRWPPRRRRRA